MSLLVFKNCFLYICSTEEVVTDKGCGHRLPPFGSFSPGLLPARRPSPCPARSLQHPLAARMLSLLARSSLGGWELADFSLTATTCPALPRCLDPPGSRVPLPPRHVAAGRFQASPLLRALLPRALPVWVQQGGCSPRCLALPRSVLGCNLLG